MHSASQQATSYWGLAPNLSTSKYLSNNGYTDQGSSEVKPWAVARSGCCCAGVLLLSRFYTWFLCLAASLHGVLAPILMHPNSLCALFTLGVIAHADERRTHARNTRVLLLCSQSQAKTGCCNPVKHLALWSKDTDHAAASQLPHTTLDAYKLIVMH